VGDTLRIGTRSSALAIGQAELVRALLESRWPHLTVELVPLSTRGDKEQDKPLPALGGKGLFTAELEAALRSGEIDLAVHSLKDLPTGSPPDLTLAAIPSREDPHDVLISRHGLPLEHLPPHPVVGTSSNRRAAQVRLLRPDARILPLRGNVDTRVRKALDPDGPYDAVVLALAGLIRLGLHAYATQILPLDLMLPAPGQGALGIQCRDKDERVMSYLRPLDDESTRVAVTAERAFLEGLGGGCALPVAALASVEAEIVYMRGLYVGEEGMPIRVEGKRSMSDARQLGLTLAARVLAQSQEMKRQQFSGLPFGETSKGGKGSPPPEQTRVLVTRAPDQAAELSDRLRAMGMEPVLYPTIRIAPPEDPRELDAALDMLYARGYDWLVLTSVNGVRFVWERLHALALGPFPAGVKVAVIGPATAEALRKQGVEPDLVPETYVAEGLAEAMGVVRGRHILLARADRARPTLRDMLRRRGAYVDEVVAYRTLVAPPQTSPPEVDVVTFTSPSTVRGFAEALQGSPLPSNVKVVCIGPVTAQAAREAGFPVHAVATTYTIPGLVAAIRSLQSSE